MPIVMLIDVSLYRADKIERYTSRWPLACKALSTHQSCGHEHHRAPIGPTHRNGLMQYL